MFLFFKSPRPAMGPIQPPIQWVSKVLSLVVKQVRCDTITQHLVLTLRISGAVQLFPLYAFRTYAGITLTFTTYSMQIKSPPACIRYLKIPTNALEFSDIILLYSKHRRVSAIHVAIFRMLRTRIQL